MAISGNFNLNEIPASNQSLSAESIEQAKNDLQFACLYDVHKGLVDICATNFYTEARFLRYAPFIQPFNSENIVIVTKKEIETVESLWEFFSPFHYYTWLSIVVGTWFLIVMYQYFERGYNQHEFPQDKIYLYNSFNNLVFGVVSLSGKFLVQKPRTFFGMLIALCMAVNFTIWVTAYTANLSALLIVSRLSETCREVNCLVKNRSKVYSPPKLREFISPYLPQFTTHGMWVEYEDLEMNIQNTNLSTIDTWSSQVLVGLEALLNDRVYALILSYDEVIDLRLLTFYDMLIQEGIQPNFCELLYINTDKPIFISYVGAPMNPNYYHKLNGLMIQFMYDGTIPELKQQHLKGLKTEAMKMSKGNTQCRQRTRAYEGLSVYSYYGMYIGILPVVLLSVMVWMLQCLSCCKCCTISMDRDLSDDEHTTFTVSIKSYDQHKEIEVM